MLVVVSLFVVGDDVLILLRCFRILRFEFALLFILGNEPGLFAICNKISNLHFTMAPEVVEAAAAREEVTREIS